MEESQLDIETLKKHLDDRWWRLNNLYYIKDKKGNRVLFEPAKRKAQKELYENLWFMNIVPKARQLGITTFFTILYFDQILFSDDKTAGIIAHRQEDMKKIFKHKIKYAWDNLHPWLKSAIGEPNADNAYELSFPNGSSIFVSMSTRSGTIQFLHISEFGKICAKYPDKAEEIVTGAINSVDVGQFVSIESTAEGKEGYFYDFCMEAEKRQVERKELSPLDFKLFFFPWYIDPSYRLEGKEGLSQEILQYFSDLSAKVNVKFSEEQMRWYSKKKEHNKDKMFQEYPSTLAEAFSASVEGAYYASELRKVYASQRIRPVPHDPDLEVDTWWDLGMDDTNVILFTQTKGGEIRFIDMYYNHGEKLEHYYDVLKERREEFGYRYGRHYLPHDAEVRELQTGLSRRDNLSQLGLAPITIGKKMSILDGINNVRRLFSRFVFDERKCQKLHESLFNYRKDFDHKLGKWKDKPRHDENSHYADAVRLLANEWREPFKFDSSGYSEEEIEQAFFG